LFGSVPCKHNSKVELSRERRKGTRKVLPSNGEVQISLSLLEYERQLREEPAELRQSEIFSKIGEIVNSGEIYSLHIDVMRPPLIPNRSAFPIQLVREICESFHGRILLEIHLMVTRPDHLVRQIDEFIKPERRTRTSVIIQREAYDSEKDAIETLRKIKGSGYQVGIGLNLPTPFESLSDEIVQNADLVLIMSVPMGRGGQKYDAVAHERIKEISKRFPDKPIKVDGGINEETIQPVVEAGAKIIVVGSFISMSKRPVVALRKLRRALHRF